MQIGLLHVHGSVSGTFDPRDCGPAISFVRIPLTRPGNHPFIDCDQMPSPLPPGIFEDYKSHKGASINLGWLENVSPDNHGICVVAARRLFPPEQLTSWKKTLATATGLRTRMQIVIFW